MIVSVAMQPGHAASVEGSVCVVLDVLRASSTVLALFQAGATDLILAESPEAALELAGRDRPRYFVCGERGGLKVVGFDYGNSPTELAAAELSGRTVLFVTSNGTRALRAVAGAPLVLVGSPRNEVAVMRLAVREAYARGCDLLLVCAGEDGGRRLALEDTYVAGMLVERVLKLSARRVLPEDAPRTPTDEPEPIALDDSAIVAHRLFRSYARAAPGAAPSDTILSVFGESRSGRFLAKHGFAADLEYCAEIDVTTVVPRLDMRGASLAVVGHA